MVSPGLYDERGLLHPFIDWDVPPVWLNKAVDPMDDEGFAQIPLRLGEVCTSPSRNIPVRPAAGAARWVDR